jgi:hypothetical protein
MAVDFVMMRVLFLAAVVLVACGSAARTATSGSPVIIGDACALHEDATSCRADAGGCTWYPNTRACVVGQPCAAGWCYHQQPTDGGNGSDGGVSASCACPGASSDVCRMQIGGPAIQVDPAISCEAIPAGCSFSDRCACLAQGTVERCWSSDQVMNLCVCDDGVR